MSEDSNRNKYVDRALADHRALIDKMGRTDSLQNLESTYPKGPTRPAEGEHARLDTARRDAQLDKTLGTVKEGLPEGPKKTPGGFGQVFR
jgi:hypothetical protein